VLGLGIDGRVAISVVLSVVSFFFQHGVVPMMVLVVLQIVFYLNPGRLVPVLSTPLNLKVFESDVASMQGLVCIIGPVRLCGKTS
jgi:hypothetical protein